MDAVGDLGGDVMVAAVADEGVVNAASHHSLRKRPERVRARSTTSIPHAGVVGGVGGHDGDGEQQAEGVDDLEGNRRTGLATEAALLLSPRSADVLTTDRVPCSGRSIPRRSRERPASGAYRKVSPSAVRCV